MGWTAAEVPLADGGDGLLAAFTGETRRDEVTGPLGKAVQAEWKLVPPSSDQDGPTAIIEMANASGLVVVGGELENDPVRASTIGTGQLVMLAVDLGARPRNRRVRRLGNHRRRCRCSRSHWLAGGPS